MGRSSLSKTQRGFTLIELMVVVAIIGLMTAAIAVNTSAARVQSRDAKRKTDAANIAATLEVYYSEKRQYPGAALLPDGTANPAPITSLAGSWDKLKAAVYPTYVSSWPVDPMGTDGTFGTGYVYQTNPTGLPTGMASGSLFIIDVPLEEKTESDVSTTTNCADPSNILYYTTGIVQCDGVYHYRISSR